MIQPATSTSDVTAFIARWRANEGGAERANFPLFLTELCRLIDVPLPDPADATHARNDYVFERAVRFEDAGGRMSHGRIDLYRRGCFVLEAKQSREPGGSKAKDAGQGELPSMPPPDRRGRRGTQGSWDVLMRNAREQAEGYARALPTDHGWPPFILVCDVGHAIEMFADFSGQGKAYRQFPDRGGFRIHLDHLHDPDIRDRLRAIWLDPQSLDPGRRAAIVTRTIARRLAHVGKLLENRGHRAEPVAHFLMRCLFTMFAEEAKVALLPVGSFTAFLHDARDAPDTFVPLLEELWRTMDHGGVSALLRQKIRHFNGGLFTDQRALPLNREEIGELYQAALHDWTEVEPAIFGTLLEQALDPDERRRLGAHYTPRVYVERLVDATVIEPLEREWREHVLGTVERERLSDPPAALKAVHDFHVKLAETRVLDPACGTGNFLYVALELMKRLEGDVLEVLNELGGQDALAMENTSVHPRNFLGLERNPRAAAIAQLVLWLGYLRWQLRNGSGIVDPVLERLGNITTIDAVLAHDPHPAASGPTDSGPAVSGPAATGFANPRRPAWPQADYIVGNPPFIGGKDIRARLGDDYAVALWRAHPAINKSADFVMYWWNRAAGLLTADGTRLKRFGFVTTNSITQDFSRRVMTKRLDAVSPISIVMAIPDHPWTKATRDAAAVRIAMTVARAGRHDGVLSKVADESALDTDAPVIRLDTIAGRINADLSVGTDVTGARPLLANAWLCSPGVKLHGAGFIVSSNEAEMLGLGRRDGLDRHIRPYRNGRDLTGRSRGRMAIDLLGLDAETVRRAYPEVYQHLLMTVKPERNANARASYRDHWWLFGEPRRELRPALAGCTRYIATVETAKHRVFQFLDASILPDNMLVCIASDDAFHLGILSSRVANTWAGAAGGMLEDRPRFTKSLCFDPFPFPDATPDQRQAIGALAGDLDLTRKTVLAEHPDLTLTGLYNLCDALRTGAPLDLIEQDQRGRGRVDTLMELHDRLDAAVLHAYGWPATIAADDLLSRLVSLNAERRTREKAGHVHWLRQEYQVARAGLSTLPTATTAEQIEADLPAATARKPVFPRDAIGQTAAVFAALRSGAALSSSDIARGYAQGQKVRPRIAATLEALGRLGHVATDGDRYSLRRAA